MLGHLFDTASPIGVSLGGGNPLLIGSIKANVGHLNGVNGLAALRKKTCVLETDAIPPIAGMQQLNRKIRLRSTTYR